MRARALACRRYGDAGLAQLTLVLLEQLGCEHAVCLRAEAMAGRRMRLRVAAVDGRAWPPMAESAEGAHDPTDGGICGATVFESREPLCLQRAAADPRFHSSALDALHLNGPPVRNLLALPIPSPVAGEGPLGVLELLNAVGSWGFEPHEQADVAAVCSTIAPLLHRAGSSRGLRPRE